MSHLSRIWPTSGGGQTAKKPKREAFHNPMIQREKKINQIQFSIEKQLRTEPFRVTNIVSI